MYATTISHTFEKVGGRTNAIFHDELHDNRDSTCSEQYNTINALHKYIYFYTLAIAMQ